MGLSSRAILDIIELVYYGPALPVALCIAQKHGMGRHSGWIFLVLLAVLRIIGSTTGIAADSHPSQGLIETSTIANMIGLAPLLFAWLGIIKRVNEGMHIHSFPPRRINAVHLPILVGLVLSIIGGIKLFNSNPATVKTGVTCTKVAIIFLLASLIALSAITIFTSTQMRHVMDGEQRLVFASLAVIPFLLVRIIYALIVDFDTNSTVFSLTSRRDAAVVVRAFMAVAMEFAVVSIFLAAGLATPAIPRGMVQSGRDETTPDQHRYGESINPLAATAPSYTQAKNMA